MSKILKSLIVTFFVFSSVALNAQTSLSPRAGQKINISHLYIDVHHLKPGETKFHDVAKAHAKDLAAEKKYGVDFKRFWVDEKNGYVYCLSSAPDTNAIHKTHGEAHGLLPAHIYEVTDGPEAAASGDMFFLDVHELGPGKVTAADVAGAHQKDLATQGKYGVSFINYWVDEKAGTVMCLSEAKDSSSIRSAHKEAHGLIPAYILKVQQGK